MVWRIFNGNAVQQEGNTMQSVIPQIIGLCAVAAFLLSYQQKKRSSIIFLNILSRCLYILQYILLGAYAGAVLDILGAVSSVIAGKKHTAFIRNHSMQILVAVNACIIAAGVLIACINRNWLDLLAVLGVLLHTSAFWLSNEKRIRQVSLLGSPFWFVYNFLSRAYGSAIGDLLTISSILLAMARYKDRDAG